MFITEDTLKELKKPLKLKWRVKGFLPNNVNPEKMILIGYVDARQVQDRFDEVLSASNWQTEYYEVKGKQFCKIGIKIGSEWIWKGDSGTESFSDPGKGETSDSFKRAAVHWGVNRDTYEMGEINIKCILKDNKPYPCDEKGNILFGESLLQECKRISSLKDSELIFDRNIIPATPAAESPELPGPKKREKKPKNVKIILP
ncbi:Rad52/Rad22 family DNA repair protein [Chryseobacterium mucoviscidosis]|uniref:Rad52/Rad22 family DNA repair protein n=1 Tax=Chryseobacterium mucoviscidosis TaxID=1945581 RepID=UPI003019E11E